MSLEALQKKFEEELENFKKIQKDYSKTSNLRSQLDGQLNENKIVKEELDRLEAGAIVYKLIGPALLRQDMEEARQNVNKRIDYITQEIKRHETTLEISDKDQDAKREVLGKLQSQLQQMTKQMTLQK